MKRKARRKDCYSIVTENLSHNPFMTKIMKSSDFTPEPGVKHTDNIQLAHSPSCSGGDFKSPRDGIMSRKEFELRTSLTVLKEFGPEKTSKRNTNVTQSMEIKPLRTGFSSAGKSFSNLSGISYKPQLPKIKVFNKESVNELIASIQEVKANKEIIEQVGPSPGAFSIANVRKQLRQSPENSISFKRVGIKQPLQVGLNRKKRAQY